MPIKTTFSRRTLLQGLGVSIGLPLLESLKLRPLAAAENAAHPLRLLFIYVPGGVNKDEWTPTGEGRDWQASATLKPLEKVREDVLILSGLDSRNGETGDNGHPLGCAPFLSTAPINERDRGGFCTDISIDQVAAKQLGMQTRLPSLELGCDPDSSDLHYSNISWRSAGAPAGKEYHPRRAFARLFGDVQGDHRQLSVLDVVRNEAKQLDRQLGSQDRQKLDEYFESIRALEKRIQITEQEAEKHRPPEIDLPASVPKLYSEHIQLLNDVIVLGFQQDASRVCTFMFGDEPGRGGWQSELGFKDHHHALAHLKPDTDEGREKLRKIQMIDQFFIEQLTQLLVKMKNVPEGEGNLLDNSLVLYGSGLEWGRKHNRQNLPLILAGGGCGTIQGGRHIVYPNGTPVSNLHLSILDRAGVELDRVADSTGRLEKLA
jgi:hypothetical protein